MLLSQIDSYLHLFSWWLNECTRPGYPTSRVGNSRHACEGGSVRWGDEGVGWGGVGYMGWGDEREKGDLTYHKHTSAWVVWTCMIIMQHTHTRHSQLHDMLPATHTHVHMHAHALRSTVNMFTDSKNICKCGYACNCITRIATSHLTKSWYSTTRGTTYTVYEYMTWAFSVFGCSKIFQLMPTYRLGLLTVAKIDTTCRLQSGSWVYWFMISTFS